MKDPNRIRIQSGLPYRVPPAQQKRRHPAEAPGVGSAPPLSQRRRREIIEPTSEGERMRSRKGWVGWLVHYSTSSQLSNCTSPYRMSVIRPITEMLSPPFRTESRSNHFFFRKNM